MGVDYRAMIYVGKEFENAYEAEIIKEVKVY